MAFEIITHLLLVIDTMLVHSYDKLLALSAVLGGDLFDHFDGKVYDLVVLKNLNLLLYFKTN